jgi:hypothetical protein
MQKTNIIFDINKCDGNKVNGDIILLKDNNTYSRYPSVSGNIRSASLPLGEYDIVSCYKLSETAVKLHRLCMGEKFSWIAGIIPQFDTTRSGLAIHPENQYPGTDGCIAAIERDSQLFDELCYLLIIYPKLRMKVVGL